MITSNDGYYEERGVYKEGVRHGKVHLRKGTDEDTILYDYGKQVK